jgi:hypothetical protein
MSQDSGSLYDYLHVCFGSFKPSLGLACVCMSQLGEDLEEELGDTLTERGRRKKAQKGSQIRTHRTREMYNTRVRKVGEVGKCDRPVGVRLRDQAAKL